ncbi:MAG: A24 family peptidase [Candidatus Longimicrobiales bacterium M2_2A_002]
MALILKILIAALLVAGALMDARTARIPNRLILAGLLLAPVAMLAQSGLEGLGASLAAGVIAFLVGFAAFALGAIGGGDAKFLIVAAAGVGLADLLALLLASAALGGVLAFVVILWSRRGVEATVMTMDLAKSAATLGHKGHRSRLGDEGRITVPYGVAIAGGALICLFTPFADWILR